MKKFLCLTASILILTIAQPVLAQEATQSSSKDEEVKINLKKIIQEASKNPNVQKVLGELSQSKRGFIGQVNRVTEESLTLTNSKGTEIIAFDETVTLLKNNQEISIDEVAVDDWLVVMGLMIDDAFVPKRILVSSESIRPQNHLITMGTIVEQTSKEITVLSRKDEEIKFAISSKTEYQDHDGEVAVSNDFVDDFQVLIVANEDEDGKNANVIRSLVSLETIQDDV